MVDSDPVPALARTHVHIRETLQHRHCEVERDLLRTMKRFSELVGRSIIELPLINILYLFIYWIYVRRLHELRAVCYCALT